MLKFDTKIRVLVMKVACLIVNRQIGITEFKYGVTGEPLFTGHVTQLNVGQKIG